METVRADEYQDLIDYEEEFLRSWEAGDKSTVPKNWTIKEQKAYILGLKHARDVLKGGM